MNYFIVFGFLMVFVFTIGIISTAEAHPHATIDLMESHSHVFADEKFHDNFIIHTFDQVIFSITDFFNRFLS
ncbi:hypothetical protein AAA799E16_00404 [Marine Group I thaumarchaeote SCGC AAA799-E16]|uniref:Uncharacterized protein n=3 Tax=Marine Group I TaxID=905826 RepID=A0A087RN24_9ARCH|nr:hypothetical protein AAA799E16_00404 [Marine Group I thaumarchaeote SCGC AAA799-E16]KFM14878.1 hypothetical protein AAA799D11_01584 [Marine Group I thaumarchaeote SCGC AAA799-D11]KFM17647.1 hypothetical protein SCCGRSA3_01577 [Marine Group I thaumarchaeote SCGC RSA3]